MEKASFRKQMHHFKFKVPAFDYGGELSRNPNFIDGGDLGFSWPPRSYVCSFCKREFRSAQALGGHMNVHRRDRARLRQSPPPRDGQLNLNVEPNPSFLSNPNSAKFPHFTDKSTPVTADFMKVRAARGVLGSPERRKPGFVRLDLEIGLISAANEEELDLELRLGYT